MAAAPRVEGRGRIRELLITDVRVQNRRNVIVRMEREDNDGQEQAERTHDTQGRALSNEVCWDSQSAGLAFWDHDRISKQARPTAADREHCIPDFERFSKRRCSEGAAVILMNKISFARSTVVYEAHHIVHVSSISIAMNPCISAWNKPL